MRSESGERESTETRDFNWRIGQDRQNRVDGPTERNQFDAIRAAGWAADDSRFCARKLFIKQKPFKLITLL